MLLNDQGIGMKTFIIGAGMNAGSEKRGRGDQLIGKRPIITIILSFFLVRARTQKGLISSRRKP